MLWHPLDLPEFFKIYKTDEINGTFSSQELFNLSKKHIDNYKDKLRELAIHSFNEELELFWFDFGVKILKDNKWMTLKIYSYSYSPIPDENKGEEYFYKNFIIRGKFKLYFSGKGDYERKLF